MNEINCPAPAKLNLFLHVIGRRSDGYHLLETVFRFVDYGDIVHLRLRHDERIVRVHPLAGVPEEQDLCVRAARLLQQTAAVSLGVEISLDKRLPMGGGLGGGSSDAASVLLGLNRLWRLNWPRERLQTLALQLGADVPVFVFGQSAFAQGIGEQLQAVTLSPAWYLVLVPPVHVSTPKIFAHQQLTRDSKSIRITDFSEAAQLLGLTRNDLQAVACLEYPVVAEYLAWLNQYAPARMTGSGACVFAEFADEMQAQKVYALLPGNMRGFVARGMDRHPLYDLAK
ncbi:4-(cytidine 5'-diphospho)-2-C-methyl-D-erythritol kinase [Sulfuriferula sp. AH1]|uniref:4-(cytidine 5'-diphospho)-2-C-methyl-D-erythritol kinase n=1 Tax=Sulfuriferula sp. AH1 TaxID=1985873 RepID=UPI000B3B2590|nr:4-(cytidine 5'-diphospho)-2-C-methyl-D-erythritol kinase [Sulfuriferula sp. AH1]ARU32382.1 4-(cytidine 5'-diphospho)-2-C-methyl-D-erythritol kinase [Sulfuriferula sp. AH1]